ncbi:putative integral membrane protein Pth11-like [Aspergillus affinis]|uniref:putative integral membrane protein Pth11-like n=1 Tax=Aspergillus affinis TaxID=1070780 RepID=UPI0022FEF80C|nr:uncharacterized protein KD926_000675 [Aspergillus affinis]KAI9037238.1 integral membrane protein [Aspergillus affinis]
MSLSEVSDSGAPGDFEHPNENLRRTIIVSLYFAFIVSTVAVVLRLVARRITGTGLFLDDYLILIALLFKYGCSIGTAILLFNGMGSHLEMIPPDHLTVYLKIGWSNSFIYTTAIMFTKLSILALYKRLFSTHSMVLTVNIVALFVILWTFAVYIVSVMQCIPVQKFWIPTLDGQCIEPAKLFYTQQIPNILSDVILLVIPLKPVWSLSISKKQRVLLSFVFLVGCLTLIFDIVRLVAMIQFTHSGPDITFNQVPMAAWTCTEAAVAITAASMSSFRPLFRLGRRKFWTEVRQSTSPGHYKKPTKESQGFSTQSTVVDPYLLQDGIYMQHSVSIQDKKV